MPRYNIPNSTTGIDTALREVTREIPSFPPSLFFFIFMLVFLGGSISQRRRTGSADIPMWATMAGLASLMIALPLTIVSGIVDTVTLGVLVTITLGSALWLFLNRNRREVY